jgi:hypothetical protein
VGYDEVPTGDIVCRIVPAYQVKFDRTVRRFEYSAYLRYRQRLRTEVVEATVPWWRSSQGDEEREDPAMRAERILTRSVGNMQGGSGSVGSAIASNAAEPGMTLVDQWWFRPELYARIVLARDVELAGGGKIPAGKLVESFPSGLYVLSLNGEPIDFRDEDFTDHWQHTPFVLVPTRVDGDGIEDMVEAQKEYNDVKGLILSNIKHVDGAGLMYRPEYLKQADVSGKPYEMYPVQNLPPEVPLNSIIAPVPRPALNQEVFAYLEAEDREMQSASKGFSGVTGAPDVKQIGGDTATGMSLMSQNARSMRAPELALRAAGNIRWAEQVLKLFKENATDARYIPFNGKTGGAEGAWFKGSDIDGDFFVTAKPRSWVPKGELDRRGDLMGALQAVGGIQGLAMVAQQMPKLLAEISEVFDVDLDIADASLDSRVARLRLDSMKQMLPQAQAMAQGDPNTAAQILTSGERAQVDPEDNHDAQIQFYRRWLTTDEGLEADPLLRAAVHAQIQEHRQAQVQQAQQQQQQQMAAQAPAMQQQQQQAAQQQQQAMQAQQQSQQQELAARQQGEQAKATAHIAGAAIQAHGQLANQQAQRDHDALENELDREHEAQMAMQTAQSDQGPAQQ